MHVVGEMVRAETTTAVLNNMSLGINSVMVDAAPFGATSRKREFFSTIPLADAILHEDRGPQTVDACVQEVHPGGTFETIPVGRSDGKLGTIKASRPPNAKKRCIATGVVEPIGIEVMERVMGFPLGYTAAAGVSAEARERMLGNSIQVYVLRHLLRPLIRDGMVPMVTAAVASP